MQNSLKIYHTLVDYFDQIYIINLPTRQDRHDEMEEQLNSIGLSITHPKIHLFEAIRPDDYKGWPSLGTKGCFMSHYQVLLHAKNKGYRNILIFEDDLNFNSDFNTTITSVIEQLQTVHWDMFYGGHELNEIDDMKLEMAYQQNAMLTKNLYFASAQSAILCNHFLALNKATIAALVHYLYQVMHRKAGDPAGGPMHVDGAYSRFRHENKHIQTILAYPQLGYQRSSRTDIHELQWYDTLPIVRDVTKTIRKVSNQSYFDF